MRLRRHFLAFGVQISGCAPPCLTLHHSALDANGKTASSGQCLSDLDVSRVSRETTNTGSRRQLCLVTQARRSHGIAESATGLSSRNTRGS
ncbi:hypothetical protein GE09DRAFT_182538 [Coniochaeta sp. 2T2.1]|nr:hypothetical protein GE09DRAFT_182538 [Coniochaeta sp. 2T2.1]